MPQNFPASETTPIQRGPSRLGITLVEILLVGVILAVVISITVVVTRRMGQSIPVSSVDAGMESDEDALPAWTERETGRFPGGGDTFEDDFADESFSGEEPDVTPWAGAEAEVPPKVIRAVAPESPSSALGSLETLLAGSNLSAEAAAQLIGQLRADEMAYAWGLVDVLPWSREKDEVRNALLGQWARLDPEAAMDFSSNAISSRRRRMDAIQTVAEIWRASNPQALLDWHVAHPDLYHASLLNLGDAVKRIYASNPTAGLAALWALPGGRAKTRALHAIFLAGQEDGYKSLLNVYDLAPDSGARTLVAEALTSAWASEDPLAAANWVERLNDPKVREVSLWVTAMTWGRLDPEGAIRWLQRTGAVPDTGKPLARVVGSWARDDPEAVLAWVDRQSPSDIKDVALAGVSQSMRNTDPVRAMEIAESIGNSDQRYRAMDLAARRWALQDREAAVIYVLQSDLPDSIKRRYAQNALRE